MTSEGSKTRLRFEGDSNEVIRTWPADLRQDLGPELQRLDRGERPLRAKNIGDSLSEIYDQDEAFWYRVLYWLNSGWVYILHAFVKKTNEIPLSDINLAKTRRKIVIQRKDDPAPQQENEKSA